SKEEDVQTDDQEFKKKVDRYKWIFDDPGGYGSDIPHYKVNRWKREFDGSTSDE
ncbi:11622_t:CDS:2, partial [Racocetra persica]